MNYEEFLKQKGLEPGDVVKIDTITGTVQGILMPHHEFSDEGVLVVKLKNGYNIGLAIEKIKGVELVQKRKTVREEEGSVERSPELPDVAVVGTGGTIASYVDYHTGAVHPAKSPGELVKAMPELFRVANIHPEILFSVLSEDMDVKMWQQIAEKVAEKLRNGMGVVITHGTDTMGYTAAALAFMFTSLPCPVVLVGSQRSSDRPSSDAHLNLLSAVRFAASADVGDVCVVMHEGTSDNRCAVHPGTKVRKMHTTRRDAFRTVNAREAGYVDGEKVVVNGNLRKPGPLRYDTRMEERVNLLYYYPGMSERLFRAHFEGAKGVVIAGTGLGHVNSRFVPVVRDYIRQGCAVVMTSQCIHGTVNMNVYSTGRELIRAGVIDGKDMLAETAYVKLMWVLAHAGNQDEVKTLMETSIAGEISARREV
ncbi:MAG: Glu-tRNA(Gln) amidotransferase subunit GatD [Thermoplasmata archaeon]|nr:Glu-tRNA(Gln) amidotransferase subunit GatD [Thermoplasmata archaeon]